MSQRSASSKPIDTEFNLGQSDDLHGLPLPPTVRLPPVKRISATSLKELHSCVDYLRVLYNPEVRGSRRRNNGTRSWSKANGHDAEEREREMEDRMNRVETIRADVFEHSHAIRWLTALIARAGELDTSDRDVPGDGVDYGDDKLSKVTELASELERENLIECAAALLAACAGTAGSGRVSRTYTFGPTPQGERVSLTLTDVPLENGDYASVGAQTWGGACVLADMIFENPERFNLPVLKSASVSILNEEQGGFSVGGPEAHGNASTKAFRILELGAGTGLVGIAVVKLIKLRNLRTDVVLTDFYPSVLENLRSNVIANFPSSSDYGCVDVCVTPLDWSSYTATTATGSGSNLGTFDLILGADIIYESEHARWIKSCLQKLLRPNEDVYFHLVIPLRRTHRAESNTVEQVFGTAESDSSDSDGDNEDLRIVWKETFICDALGGTAGSRFLADGAEEVEYAYYKIGWKKA